MWRRVPGAETALSTVALALVSETGGEVALTEKRTLWPTGVGRPPGEGAGKKRLSHSD